ncbi:MAG: fold metallo-hydrolase [Candidatus Saccharibacteria bacterium]|nr:fold metallo-hydrolase [Candidatus Saccharibacteria bacterium]
MLKQVANGVWVHNSEFLESKSIIVQGKAGVLLIDPGITEDELVNLASDLDELGQPVVAGFSTHPHWDHVLWHAQFGEVPRYSTAHCAADIRDLLSYADWKARVAGVLPPDIGNQIPIDNLFGQITGLPVGTTYIPWDGPSVRIIEHQAHARGHAALLIEEANVLVAGDMLSNILIPFLELEAKRPVEDYLAALQLLENVAGDTTILITGHGSVGGAGEVRTRIGQDRAYVQALHDGGGSDDSRLTTGPNKEWLPSVHERQAQQLAKNAVRG